jgi:gamma-glutamyltranspeptidase/glutathione hydrolase
MSSRSRAGSPGPAGSFSACVSSGSAEASEAGLEILKAGGNAADAAAGMLLTLSVTNLGAVCPGGEAAGIVAMADAGGPSVICGQGRAPLSNAVASWDPNSARGGIQDATTPALISYVCTLLKRFGTVSLAKASSSMLEQLRNGRLTSHFDTGLKREITTLTGEFVQPGQATMHPDLREWQTDLAATINRLLEQEARHAETRQLGIQAAHQEFYQGETASLLSAWYKEKHALLSGDDLNACTSAIEAPVTTTFGDFEVHSSGPWAQGPLLNMVLNTVKAAGIEDLDYGSAEYLHTVIEAMKLGFADRDRYLADPDYAEIPLDSLLDVAYAGTRARIIESRYAEVRPSPGLIKMNSGVTGRNSSDLRGRSSSTVCCLVSDHQGNVVITTSSGVGSIAGAGGQTGVTHGTRMRAFDLHPDHQNAVAPGKRPRSTLAPFIVTRRGRVVIGYSSPGGDFQVQMALQLLLNIARFGLQQENIEQAFRGESTVALHHRAGMKNGRSIISADQSLPRETLNSLSERGHRIMPAKINLDQLGGGLIYWDDAESDYRVCGHCAMNSPG